MTGMLPYLADVYKRQLKTRRDCYHAYTQIDTRQLFRTSRQLARIIGQPIPPNKAIVGANAFAHEAGIHQHGVMQNRATYEIMSPEDVGVTENNIVLGKHSGRHAFLERLATPVSYTHLDVYKRQAQE